MNQNLINQQIMFEKKRGTIISLLSGIISLIPGIIYIGIWSWFINIETWFQYLERYWFTVFFLAIICGMVGFKMGIKNLKLDETPVLIKILSWLGVILSGLGIISTLLIIAFGLWTAGF